MNDFTVTITKTLSPSKIADQVITAFESGISYWAASVNLVTPSRETLKESPWYADPDLYKGEFRILIVQQDEHIKDAGVNLYLTPENVQSGLNAMSEKYQDHFRDLVDENGDATTADVFIQCCVFSELVYG